MSPQLWADAKIFLAFFWKLLRIWWPALVPILIILIHDEWLAGRKERLRVNRIERRRTA